MKKLIEVALPLPEINDASAYDKMPGIGPHPKGIHHWWARLPLPTARAVLFASVVDDPSAHPEKFPTEDLQNAERERLFGILRRLMQKKMHDRPEVYAEARAEMLKHCGGKLPPVLDPFAGGGSIPLEANRLGFEAHACDLNPVAVLLNKCNLEIVPHWVGKSPVNPEARKDVLIKHDSKGAKGLADDVRYYGSLIRQRAIEKIGHLYPKVKLPKDHGGGEADVIAWLWARTVKCPNPACGAKMPLARSFVLSTKKVWAEPTVDKKHKSLRFEASTNHGKHPEGTVNRRGARCVVCGETVPLDHVRSEGKAGKLSAQLLSIVADRGRGKAYVPPIDGHEGIVSKAKPQNVPDTHLPEKALGFRVQGYGMTRHADLFTQRQLAALVTHSDLIRQVRSEVVHDAEAAGLDKNAAAEYGEAMATFLGLALDRCADFNNSLCRWSSSNQKVMNLFGRQTIPMVWDFAEANILGEAVGAWSTCSDYVADCIQVLGASSESGGKARQIDAASAWNDVRGLLVSTDPPYYDNIGYAVLSDFFYTWLRRTIGDIHPELFKTILVPKAPELTASPDNFDGDRSKAREHFESGFRKAFTSLRDKMDASFPLTVYYAFKQDDEDSGDDESTSDDEAASGVDLTTGWETLLEALLSSGFQITATWPVRASQAWRMRAMGSNALASYIVLACRLRPQSAPRCSRREFLADIKKELPPALKLLRQGNIAPVDFQQAALGPGMAVFSRYSQVLEANGKPMTVRSALALINQILGDTLSELEGEFDSDTRWALTWFEQHGMDEGDFGEAEVLSKAKNTSVTRLAEEGIIIKKAGKVRLVRRSEFSKDWDPAEETRLPAWTVTQHFVRALDEGGENAAAALLRKAGGAGEAARDLAYRLFSICERKKWAQEGLAYNSLVVAWPEIVRLSGGQGPAGGQGELL